MPACPSSPSSWPAHKRPAPIPASEWPIFARAWPDLRGLMLHGPPGSRDRCRLQATWPGSRIASSRTLYRARGKESSCAQPAAAAGTRQPRRVSRISWPRYLSLGPCLRRCGLLGCPCKPCQVTDGWMDGWMDGNVCKEVGEGGMLMLRVVPCPAAGGLSRRDCRVPDGLHGRDESGQSPHVNLW